MANVDVDFCRGFIDFLRYAKNAVRKDGSVTSNGAAHHHQAVLNGALNKAVRDGILSANPLKSISSKEKYQPTESMRGYIPLDRLCPSPQCGFASCEIGNKLTEEEQWAKIQLVKEITEEVWG